VKNLGLVVLCLSLATIFSSNAQADDAPVFVSGPKPEYTKKALRLGIGGTVEFKVRVDANGNIDEATAAKVRFEVTIDQKTPSSSFLAVLSQAGQELVAAARENMCSWKFTPAIVDGKPHEAVITITIVFTPPSRQKDVTKRMDA
jgi:hypothetical protein